VSEPEQPEGPTEGLALGSEGARLRRLFANTSIYAVGQLGLQLISAFLTPILTLFLVPADFGIWSLSMMLLTGFSLLYNPALNGAVTRFYFDHEHDDEQRRRFQGTILSFIVIWAGGLSLLALIAGPWLFDAAFADLPFWPYGAFVVVIAFVGVFGAVPRAMWVAAERSKTFVSVTLLASSVNLLGSLGLVAFTTLGVLGLFWGRTASVVVVAVPYIVFCVRHVGLAWDRTELRRALVFSLPLVLHLAAHWILGMSDRVLIERYYADPASAPLDALELGHDPEAGTLALSALGIYGASYFFIEAVNMIAMSMNRAWVPQFTRAYNHPEERPFVARSISWFILAVAAMSVAMIVLSPTAVRLLFDDKYSFAAEVAPILAAGGLFQGIYYIYVAGLFYFKANRLIPFITVVSGLTNIGLNIMWIPAYGLVGAAWATLVGYLVLVVGMRWGCRRLTRLPFERKRLARIAGTLSVATVIGVALDDRLALGWEIAAKLATLGLAALVLWRLDVFSKHNNLQSDEGAGPEAPTPD